MSQNPFPQWNGQQRPPNDHNDASGQRLDYAKQFSTAIDPRLRASVFESVQVPPELGAIVGDPQFLQVLLRVKDQTGIDTIRPERTGTIATAILIDAPSAEAALLARKVIECHFHGHATTMAAEERRLKVQTNYYSTQGEVASGHVVELTVNPELVGIVIGKKGANIKKVESESGVSKVTVEGDSGRIKIVGPDSASVQRAVAALEIVEAKYELSSTQMDFYSKNYAKELGSFKAQSEVSVARLDRATQQIIVIGTKTCVRQALVILETQREYIDLAVKIEEEARVIREQIYTLKHQYGFIGDREYEFRNERRASDGGRGGVGGQRRRKNVLDTGDAVSSTSSISAKVTGRVVQVVAIAPTSSQRGAGAGGVRKSDPRPSVLSPQGQGAQTVANAAPPPPQPKPNQQQKQVPSAPAPAPQSTVVAASSGARPPPPPPASQGQASKPAAAAAAAGNGVSAVPAGQPQKQQGQGRQPVPAKLTQTIQSLSGAAGGGGAPAGAALAPVPAVKVASTNPQTQPAAAGAGGGSRRRNPDSEADGGAGSGAKADSASASLVALHAASDPNAPLGKRNRRRQGSVVEGAAATTTATGGPPTAHFAAVPVAVPAASASNSSASASAAAAPTAKAAGGPPPLEPTPTPSTTPSAAPAVARAAQNRDRNRERPCYEWAREGSCRNGSGCRFLHAGGGESARGATSGIDFFTPVV